MISDHEYWLDHTWTVTLELTNFSSWAKTTLQKLKKSMKFCLFLTSWNIKRAR